MFQKKPKKSQASQPKPPEKPTNYPTGLAVKTESGYWLIRGNFRLKFFSSRVFESWRLRALPSTDKAISNYINAGTLGFRDSSLIKNIADGKMYLITESKRRHITSPEVFERLALSREYMIEASEKETQIHAEGEPLE